MAGERTPEILTELTAEELEAETAAELPERECMSIIVGPSLQPVQVPGPGTLPVVESAQAQPPS